MISVSMREDDVFDPPGIQAELSHAAEDFVLRRIIVQRFENDGSLVAGNCPRTVNLRAKEIKVVGNLGWFCVPRFPGRRSGRGPTRASACSRGSSKRRSARRRWDTEAKKGARPLETSRIFGCPEQAVNRGGKRLRRHRWTHRDDGERDERYPYETPDIRMFFFFHRHSSLKRDRFGVCSLSCAGRA